MDPQYERQLEAEIDRELKALPELRAPATFIVPTGNFGDIFAGEAAMRMGLPVRNLVIATNANDILVRALKDGVYAPGTGHATLSPSMDIQVASNFERGTARFK